MKYHYLSIIALLLSSYAISQNSSQNRKVKPKILTNVKGQSATNSQALMQIMDSVYYWHWDTTNIDWQIAPYAKSSNFAYDASLNVTSYAHETFDSSAWVNQYKESHTYDANNNQITNTIQGWNNGVWENYSKDSNSYNSSNKLTSTLSQMWFNSTWNDINKATYIYNANNNLIVYLYESWTGSNWENFHRNTYTYDVNNNLTLELDENGYDTIWTNAEQYINTYDSMNNKIGYLLQVWNNSNWEDESQGILHYDTDNYLINETIKYWNGSIWSNSNQNIYSYNSSHNQINKLNNVWNDGSWKVGEITSNVFDSNNYIIHSSFKRYEVPENTVYVGDSIAYYFHLGTLGVKNTDKDSEILSISPNPASSTLRIINSPDFATLTDLTGKTLLTIPTKHKETQIDISTFSNGIYFLKTNNGQTSKVVVQH